jgi:hypothetical protein
MKYVTRDANGKVNGIYTYPVYGEDNKLLTDVDPLPNDHPDIISYGKPSLNDIKAQAIENINSFAKSRRLYIAGTPDEAEIAGWNNKLRMAYNVVGKTATPDEIAALKIEVMTRSIEGETVEILAQKIISNAAALAKAVAVIDGLKRKAQDMVNAADSVEKVARIIDTIKAEADAAFAQIASKGR